MASDIKVILEVVGAEDMVKATKATQQLENKVKVLANALNKGKINWSQYTTGVNQLISKNKILGGGYRSLQSDVWKYSSDLSRSIKQTNDAVVATERMAKATQQASVAQKNLGTATQQGSRHMSRSGVLVQQAGYQVGDFLVQVQGGTNAMVAFGQQATQMAGTLTMLGGKWLGIGTVLGITIPLFTAVGAYLMRTAKAQKEVADSAGELMSAYGGLNSKQKELTESVKLYSDALVVSKAVATKDNTEVLRSIQQEVDARKELLSVEKERFELQRFSLQEEVKARQKTIESLFDQSKAMRQTALSSATSEAERTAINKTYLEDTRRIVAENRELFLNQREQRATLSLIDALLQGNRENIEDAVDAIKDADKAMSDLLSLTLKVSNQPVYEPMSALERAAQEAQDKVVKGFEAAMKLKEELGEAAYEALRLSGVDMTSGVDAAAKAAARLAADLNIALSAAIRMQAMASDEEAVMSQPVVSGPATSRFDRDTLLGMGYTEAYLESVGMGAKKGGGGSTTKTDPKEKALEAYNKLVATYDEVEAKALKVAAAQKTLNEAESLGVITSQQSKDALEAYTRSLEDAKSPMLDLANTASQSLSSAFMAIVEGSKSAADAFKDMARAIIKQAFEMAVINPIMNSLFGGVSGFSKLPSFFANGGAFSGGSQIKAYADGGVVGGPTFFPMSGGNTGLVGEDGPEAIMPLKRGANGKLGVQVEGNSGGGVVIHQSFNFQANGDDSVKRIIASEAPKIASMTQRQIMDQRRRGGAMKSAFG